MQRDDMYGGWCYLNNASIATARLSSYDYKTHTYRPKDDTNNKRVALLDIDYHHGNGSQEIFYQNPLVLYVSTHADPDEGGEPFFIGYPGETGHENLNANFPLPLYGVTDDLFLSTLDKALKVVTEFNPHYLVVSLGCDIEVDDGCGTWDITLAGFQKIGQKIKDLHLPTLIVQEGGYNIAQLGKTVLHFLKPFTL